MWRTLKLVYVLPPADRLWSIRRVVKWKDIQMRGKFARCRVRKLRRRTGPLEQQCWSAGNQQSASDSMLSNQHALA